MSRTTPGERVASPSTGAPRVSVWVLPTDSRARNVEDMKRISTLCVFAEEAERQQRISQLP